MKIQETLKDVRAKRDAKIREGIESRKEQRAKRAESRERKYLLDLMNRLDKLSKKSHADQKAEIQNLIGEFDLTCQRLRAERQTRRGKRDPILQPVCTDQRKYKLRRLCGGNERGL
ncbi:MAG: hypothetical protein IJ106_03130 [Parasporobacterium sp.]|nr:hypothetical protein [Parasporobacterium sp.]